MEEEEDTKNQNLVYSKWPIRRQLMIRFCLLTIIVQSSIFVFIIINMNIIADKTLQEANTFIDIIGCIVPLNQVVKVLENINQYQQFKIQLWDSLFGDLILIDDNINIQQLQPQNTINISQVHHQDQYPEIQVDSNFNIQDGEILKNQQQQYQQQQQQIYSQGYQTIKIFVLNEENAKQIIDDLINKEKNVTIIISAVAACGTVSLVVIFTYYVAVTLARPLRRLIKIAQQIDNNTIHDKDKMKQIMVNLKEMEKQSQHQVKNLLTTFISLVNSIESSNRLQKTSEEQRHINYPLNQYDAEFVEKAKGNKDINWKELIQKIAQQVKDNEKK